MKTLREARISAGQTQLDIQRVTGISQTKQSLEENGHRGMNVQEKLTIERHLGAEINWNTQSQPLTPEQQSELTSALIKIYSRFGQLEALKFICKFETEAEMYQVLCNNKAAAIEPLPMTNHRRETK